MIVAQKDNQPDIERLLVEVYNAIHEVALQNRINLNLIKAPNQTTRLKEISMKLSKLPISEKISFSEKVIFNPRKRLGTCLGSIPITWTNFLKQGIGVL